MKTPCQSGNASGREIPGPALFAAWILIAALLSLPAGAAQAVEARFDGNGLAALRVNDLDILHRGSPEVAQVVLEQTFFDNAGLRQYKFQKVAEKPRQAAFDAARRTLKQEYSWGAIDYLYQPGQDRLDVTVIIHNNSSRTIANFELVLCELAFPALPASWKKGQAVWRNSLDNLAILQAEVGKSKLFVGNLTIDPLMTLGFGKATDKSGLVFPLALKGGVYAAEPGAFVIEPHGLPRVPAKKSLTLEVTLRTAPAETPAATALADVYKKFREFHTPQHAWKDRRPIGMILHASSFKGHVSKTNPRGWLNNSKLDVITEAGKAEFRRTMLNAAERAVKAIKDTGGQGMILWDVEGQENPHPISFIGDPQLAQKMAPEMDEVADAYFQVFRDAGLRTGVCLRPSQVYFDDNNKKWSHGTGSDGGPSRGNFYPQLRPKDQPWWKFYPVAQRLSDRIDYVKKRWGCTLIYIDTNGIWRATGEDQKFRWFLLEAATWKQIKAKHPDVLLIPELPRDDQTYHAANWAHTSAYMEIRFQGYRTPTAVRDLFPEAFSVVNIADGDFDKHRGAIKAGVTGGDILMFRGWFADQRNLLVKEIYAEAKKNKQGSLP